MSRAKVMHERQKKKKKRKKRMKNYIFLKKCDKRM